MTNITFVLKFKNNEQLPGRETHTPLPRDRIQDWENLRRRHPGQLSISRLFESVAAERIAKLKLIAERRSLLQRRNSSFPNFENYLFATYKAKAIDPVGVNKEIALLTEGLGKLLGTWKEIERFYQRLPDQLAMLKASQAPIILAGADDPRHLSQEHLEQAPAGLGVQAIWALAGADGEGQQFIDVELGWHLQHPDLCDEATGAVPRVRFDGSNGAVNSAIRSDRRHGTAVLGIVGSTHNQLDTIGIVPRLKKMEVMSIAPASGVSGESKPTAEAVMAMAVAQVDAMLEARLDQRPDDGCNTVILIELQANLPGQAHYFPVEVYPDAFDVIRLVTDAGIAVIEPAGNGRFEVNAKLKPAVDLDNMANFTSRPTPKNVAFPQLKSLNRNPGVQIAAGNIARQMDNFADSGAIMVAGARHTKGQADWTPWANSNYGSRIDCFAEAQQVTTLDSDGYTWRNDFNGTSAASAIIAGAALCVQGVAQANLGAPLCPATLRSALSDAGGTANSRPDLGSIGMMPNLPAVAAKYIGPP